ncbi:MAG: hypothetical protein M5U12_20870 [Verrucomicrobia bacterium]|nr:hypothetical protein [Verrucomicrobiota bacterium]
MVGAVEDAIRPIRTAHEAANEDLPGLQPQNQSGPTPGTQARCRPRSACAALCRSAKAAQGEPGEARTPKGPSEGPSADQTNVTGEAERRLPASEENPYQGEA